MQVGDGNFGCGQQVLVAIGYGIDRVLEFGELRAAIEHLPVHNIGQVKLLIAICARCIQEEADQSPLQTRAPASQHIIAAARQFDAALKVDDAQRWSQFPMRLGLKVEFTKLANRRARDIVVFAREDRHAFVRQVGQPQHLRLQIGFDCLGARIAGLDAFAHAF